MTMKENEEKLPSFEMGTPDGEIEINPNLPSIKITPNHGRRVYLTGATARLVMDFISLLALSDDYSTEKLKEPTDGLRCFS